MSTKTPIVRFYRITDQSKLPFPNAFPFEDLQDEISSLDDDRAYVNLNRMELLGSAWKPRRGFGARRQVPLIALDRITRNPQIRIERRREYRPLVLGDSENLADPAFYSVFDDGVIGVLRIGPLAPGPASFRDYVNHLEVIKPPIHVIPLVDGNALRAIGNVGTLTKFEIRVLPDVSAEVFQQSSMIYDAIRSARRSMGSVTVEVTVSIAPKGQGTAADEALQQITNVVTTEALGSTDKAAIRYRHIEDGKASSYDFLSEAITMAAPVDIDEQTGQPSESSVAEAMASAYDTLYEDIRSAIHPRN